MSSDTSIAIAKFTDGRKHTGVIQCVENMDKRWFKNNEDRKKDISEYDWSKLFLDEGECYKHASKLQEEYEKGEEGDLYPSEVEYGIVDVGEFPFNINQPIDEPTTVGTN